LKKKCYSLCAKCIERQVLQITHVYFGRENSLQM